MSGSYALAAQRGMQWTLQVAIQTTWNLHKLVLLVKVFSSFVTNDGKAVRTLENLANQIVNNFDFAAISILTFRPYS